TWRWRRSKRWPTTVSCRRPRWPRRSRSTSSIPRGRRPGPCEPKRDCHYHHEVLREEICLAATEVTVPDIGDFKDVPVIELLVKPGDSVNKDDSLLVLQSDKATLEV